MTQKSDRTNASLGYKNSLKADNHHWVMTPEDERLLAEKEVSLPMGFQQLKCYLPHRYPFILIDRVTACCPSFWITGYKNVSINEHFFQGHFPDEPIMPGVLIIEALAQLSGVLAFITEGTTLDDGYIFLFAGVDKVRFKTPVIPGDKLCLKSQLITSKRHIYKFECGAYVDGKLAANAQLMIVRQDRPSK